MEPTNDALPSVVLLAWAGASTWSLARGGLVISAFYVAVGAPSPYVTTCHSGRRESKTVTSTLHIGKKKVVPKSSALRRVRTIRHTDG